MALAPVEGTQLVFFRHVLLFQGEILSRWSHPIIPGTYAAGVCIVATPIVIPCWGELVKMQLPVSSPKPTGPGEDALYPQTSPP